MERIVELRSGEVEGGAGERQEVEEGTEGGKWRKNRKITKGE